MPQLIADRFVQTGHAWFDLATAAPVRVRLITAGTARAQMAWDARCARLANLRHPLINPLIDYGAADREQCFEAYAVQNRLDATPRAAARLAAHARRFLFAHDVPTDAAFEAFALRSIGCAAPLRFQPIGVVLQRRAVYTAIADALDTARPGGTCTIAIEGAPHSGLRTARIVAARAARLNGYLPIALDMLRPYPWAVERMAGRHVCVLSEGGAPPPELAVWLFTKLGSESARRHVWLHFRRDAGGQGTPPVPVDPMGVVAMTGMVFSDAECGPAPEEVMSAARQADGRPGRCLAALGAYRIDSRITMPMRVHEAPHVYDAGSAAVAMDTAPAPARRTSAVLQAATQRAEALAARGRHGSATRLLRRASHVLLGRGDRENAARSALALGWLALDRGRTDAAVAAFEQARAACPSGRQASLATLGLGAAWTDDGRLIEAEAALRGLIAAAQSSGDRDLRVRAVAALARALYWLGRFDEAMAAVVQISDPEESPASVQLLTIQARLHLREGMIAAGMRTARTAVAIAHRLGNARCVASAARVLAEAAASAGDGAAVASHIADGLRAAASAHLPLASAKLRITAADILGTSCGSRERRAVARVLDAGAPRLLQFFARAVSARIDGVDLDAATAAFVRTSGAATLARASATPPVNPVVDLETLLELGHAAADDQTAIQRIAAEVQTRLRAATVLVVGGVKERHVFCSTGRAWQGEPHVAWRAAATGISAPMNPAVQPWDAAEPIRYSGAVIGAIATRWTAGTAVEPARASSLLRVAALALAGNLRSVLDRNAAGIPTPSWGDLLGDSPAACTLREQIARAARAPFPVLVQGESGSGKELVARAIHRLGARRDRRFCALNCAALSDELIEAELFGHTRGAFTGAVGERAGLFEEADGGTLFLDEIGELSARAQAKLLRVLQDGEVRRIGENVSRRVDVRIVAATNRRLEQEAAAGRFRADLRFRLDVVRIEVPPLRERPADVPVLAHRFWTDAVSRVGSRATLAPEAVAALSRYDWPGNVRELQNVMAWMAVHSPGRGRVGPAALPQHVAQATVPQGGTFESAREEFERRFVKAALASADGQRARAAQALGITRQGLAKMMRRLGLDGR
jgi:DNA-binding NtrC family response regulator/tetratricopeptide (TPR) repeat protein